MRSDMIKKGFDKVLYCSLLKVIGLKDEDFDKFFIVICNFFIEIILGYKYLNEFGKFVKEVVCVVGMVLFEFNIIGVDDGIVMGYIGMCYFFLSCEIIVDLVEMVVNVYWFDGMICILNCDKIILGMMMVVLCINILIVFVLGGLMVVGKMLKGEVVDLSFVFEGVGVY